MEGRRLLTVVDERKMDEEEEIAVASPGARLGQKVENLWDVQEPLHLPFSERLNSCFQDIPVSSFPPASASATANQSAPISQQAVIEINSDASLKEAVEILSKNGILSAPVRNAEEEASSEGLSWMDRYIGIVEFAGISVWLLHQSEVTGASRLARLASGNGFGASGAPASTVPTFSVAPAADEGATSLTGNGHREPEAALGGDFFQALTSSDLYKNTKVRDISGSFRWAPFLALQSSDTFLTMLLLLSKYGMKSLPVVDLGVGRIENIITQSDVVQVLAECVGLPWFEMWGNKKLSELGLPVMKPNELAKITEDQPVLQAFNLMRERGIGGVPVVDVSGQKPLGNISLRDVQYLLTAPEIYKDFRSITGKNFLTAVRGYLVEHHRSSPLLQGTISCKRHDSLKDLILLLNNCKIHRIYVVDDKGNLEGVVTLRDIISKLVVEPHDYFGDFFYGVVPLPPNSTV